MSELDQAMDLEEVVKVLLSLGVDEDAARDQLEAAEDDATTAAEVAALVVESEAGLLMPLDVEQVTALFDLVDGLRQAGLAVSLGQTADAPALVFSSPMRVYEARFEAEADTLEIVQAVSRLLPESHALLLAPDYDAGGALALAILERASHAWLRAAVGGERFDASLAPVNHPTASVTFSEVAPATLIAPDFMERFAWNLPEPAATSVAAVFARVRKYDARVAWPEGQKRPPGDDYLELAGALASESLQACLAGGSRKQWADLMYRFALVTTVGAHWDVLAARQNPGMSAQGVLGLGQLSWSWFIFEALGARADAFRVGELLDSDWVRNQERAPLAARQRAWYDLGAFLRHGQRRPAMRRLQELLPLIERSGWERRDLVEGALATYTEPEGDQLTHLPIYHVWPAPLYALARRAGAMELLPASDPFLGRQLELADVDMSDELVMCLRAQLSRIDSLDESRLPPLLDPLPVIVDVRITEVDAKDAHGRTQLAARDEAEHHVVAPHGGRPLKPGETWLFEVQGARPARARARYPDLGEVSYNISLPTGEWLSKAGTR